MKRKRKNEMRNHDLMRKIQNPYLSKLTNQWPHASVSDQRSWFAVHKRNQNYLLTIGGIGKNFFLIVLVSQFFLSWIKNNQSKIKQ